MSEEHKPTHHSAPVKPVSAPAAAPTGHPVGVQPTNGLAIAAMIVGIISILAGWFFTGLIFGAAAIVLGALGLKKPGGRGMAIAGIVTGGVGALIGIIFTIFFIVIFAAGAALIGSSSSIRDSFEEQNAQQQAQIDAKKDFNKGETAIFGTFEVKVNSVKRDYIPEESYYAPSEDEEYVLINLSVKNTGSESEYIYGSSFELNADGISDGYSYVTVSPAFSGGELSSDATATGNLVYKISSGDAKVLKLQYETTVYDADDLSTKSLTYTLGL